MPSKFTIADLIWLAFYLSLLALITGGMFRARAAVLQSHSEQTQADWDDWRAAVKERAADPGPVKRTVPKSIEPPMLVLLRDHFYTSLTGLLVISSVLFATLMLFARGVTGQAKQGNR